MKLLTLGVTVLMILFSYLPYSLFAQTFTTQQLQEDADLLWEALNELHPGLYRHQGTKVITAAYQQLQDGTFLDRDYVLQHQKRRQT